MLSENFKISRPEKKEYDLLPEDVYEAVIKNAEDVIQTKYQSKEEESVIEFTFEITKGEFKDRKLWKKIRPMVSGAFEKGQASGLYILLKAVNGEVLDGEVSSELINNLIGKEVKIVVIIKESDSKKQYNKIDNFLPLRKQAEDLPEVQEGEISPEEISF